jgi:poly(hydroxyalkanoate) depolymerase family esterase
VNVPGPTNGDDGISRLHQRAAKGVVAVTTALLLATASPGVAGSLIETTGFGSNPGNLRMFKYIPNNAQSSLPLVVALHGCTQNASDYAEHTGWIELAERWRFALLLPQQDGVNNVSLCFNWFNGFSFVDPVSPGSDIDRGQGEALSVKQMIDKMKATHNIDGQRIYVTGLSAGGAMTAVMLATYPEVFSGGAIIAGVPYKCTTRSWEATARCGVDRRRQGIFPTTNLLPSQWGARVRNATSHNGPWPKMSIWQGDADQTVNPANATELVEQWTNVHGIDQIPDVEDTVKGYPHKVYRGAIGTALVETYLVTGMGHGAPVDPGSGEGQCGTAVGFFLDAHICSSYYIAKFWGLDRTSP